MTLCRILAASALGVAAISQPLHAQVSIDPTTIQPAGWERLALRVINQTATPIVSVQLTVPEAVDVLGVDPLPGWTFSLRRATETTPQTIVWTGDQLRQWQFREFAFLGRLIADARRKELLFPVRIQRADGSFVEWSRSAEATGAPLVVQIVGSTRISNWGAFTMASVAIGLAILAIALAVSGRGKAAVREG